MTQKAPFDFIQKNGESPRLVGSEQLPGERSGADYGREHEHGPGSLRLRSPVDYAGSAVGWLVDWLPDFQIQTCASPSPPRP